MILSSETCFDHLHQYETCEMPFIFIKVLWCRWSEGWFLSLFFKASQRQDWRPLTQIILQMILCLDKLGHLVWTSSSVQLCWHSGNMLHGFCMCFFVGFFVCFFFSTPCNVCDFRIQGVGWARETLYVGAFRVKLRWATACCSAVTMPALACIIYPPAEPIHRKG